MNKNSIDPQKISGLLSLRKELEEGKFDNALAAMNGKDAAKFRQAVNDPKLVERLMSTPQAQALYKKLSGE